MSPTSPTFMALYRRLNKAHRRIRELEARETDLLAEIRNFRTTTTDLAAQIRAHRIS